MMDCYNFELLLVIKYKNDKHSSLFMQCGTLVHCGDPNFSRVFVIQDTYITS